MRPQSSLFLRYRGNEYNTYTASSSVASQPFNVVCNKLIPVLDDQALRPGGLVLLRDHGLYDLTHLRLTEEQRVGSRLYRRRDGTLCYFFTVENLQALMLEAGFEIVECKYACVQLRNRRRGLDMRRVFVHGIFKKPESAKRTLT